MPLEKGMRDLFLANGTVTSLIGTKFYPSKAPQTATTPYVVYRLVSERDEVHLRGYSGLTKAQYQIDAVSTTYNSARAVGDALHDVITRNGVSGTWDGLTVVWARWDNKRDELVPPFAADDAGLPRYPLDLIVWYRGT